MTSISWLLLAWLGIIGACVGSFLNVVIHRLPQGQSLVRPPSRCPRCGHQLRWWENVPVLAWFYLRGRCSGCQTKISFQYPLIEAITAGLFVLLAWIYYESGLRSDFAQLGWELTWPVLVIHLLMVACLLAATVIDARLFIIPLQIPWLVTLAALIGLPLAAYFEPAALDVLPITGTTGVHMAGGGALGLMAAILLLHVGVLPRSFDQPLELPAPPESPSQTPELPQTGRSMVEAYLTYPHPRREVLKELLFVALPIAGMVLGWLLTSPQQADSNSYTAAVHVLGGVILGYLVGGGIIWMTRILGTLGFGKEAMGLGDVHLLAGIGAVLGAADAAMVFFVAPFMGLLATVAAMIVSRFGQAPARVIPYGPFLAGAALAVMIWREPIRAFFVIF